MKWFALFVCLLLVSCLANAAWCYTLGKEVLAAINVGFAIINAITLTRL